MTDRRLGRVRCNPTDFVETEFGGGKGEISDRREEEGMTAPAPPLTNSEVPIDDLDDTTS